MGVLLTDLTGIMVTLMAALEVHLGTMTLEREITSMMTRGIIIKVAEDLEAVPSTSMEAANTISTEVVGPMVETDRTFPAEQ